MADENENVQNYTLPVCRLCQARISPAFSCPSDDHFTAWKSSFPDPLTSSFCSLCFGILEFGGPIFESVTSTLKECGYSDIYSLLLSIQLPPIITFRSLIEKLVYADEVNPAAELKDVLRGFLLRSISENPDDRFPKLFVDIQFQASPEYVIDTSPRDGVDKKVRKPNMLLEMPLPLVCAANNRVKQHQGGGSTRFKKFKDKFSISSSDVTTLFESVKNDLKKAYSLLFPSATDPVDITEIRNIFIREFLTPVSSQLDLQVSLRRETVYLVGKYGKTCRDFGQSHWDAHSTSVAESIIPSVCELFDSPIEKCLFSASGREDMDVRMLGSGRTFVLQLGDARRLTPLMDQNILKNYKINTGDVIVEFGLKFADKGVLDWLHWSTEQHVKVYRCIVWSALPFQEESIKIFNDNLKVYQSTPLRVLHRRTEHVREKYIHSMTIERINSHYAVVTLRASAGAYIKEFIHGDFGRTTPCFNDVVFGPTATNNRCDILQLDVREVEHHEDEDYVPLCERN